MSENPKFKPRVHWHQSMWAHLSPAAEIHLSATDAGALGGARAPPNPKASLSDLPVLTSSPDLSLALTPDLALNYCSVGFPRADLSAAQPRLPSVNPRILSVTADSPMTSDKHPLLWACIALSPGCLGDRPLAGSPSACLLPERLRALPVCHLSAFSHLQSCCILGSGSRDPEQLMASPHSLTSACMNCDDADEHSG